jgi:hypothetical protein
MAARQKKCSAHDRRLGALRLRAIASAGYRRVPHACTHTSVRGRRRRTGALTPSPGARACVMVAVWAVVQS